MLQGSWSRSLRWFGEEGNPMGSSATISCLESSPREEFSRSPREDLLQSKTWNLQLLPGSSFVLFSMTAYQSLIFEDCRRYHAVTRFPFLQRVTNSLERRPKPKTEPKTYSSNESRLYKEKPATPEPYYEEIAVMKKRKKKERPTTPTPCTKDLYEEVSPSCWTILHPCSP